MTRHLRTGLLAALSVALLFSAGSLEANTIVAEPNAAEGVVDDDRCSLHEAIIEANAPGTHSGGTGLQDECSPGSVGTDDIFLAPDTVYTLTTSHTLSGSNTGLPTITAPLTIQGAGATIRRDPALGACGDVSEASSFRLLWTQADLTLIDLILTGGCGVGTSGGGLGGGLKVHQYGAVVTLNRCTVSGNSAEWNGGGIHMWRGTLVLNRSTVSGNTAQAGGGIANYADEEDSSVIINNSTVSGNTATIAGGGILNGGGEAAEALIYLYSTTITDNSSPEGAAIYQDVASDSYSAVEALNTVIAGQTGGADCAGDSGTVFTSLGHNLEDGTSCGFTQTGDQQSVAAGLLPLGSGGGPTATHYPTNDSPALDAGDPAGCYGDEDGDGSMDATPLQLDQRQRPRTLDADGDETARCDIGAVEWEPPLFADGFESGDTLEW